VKRRRSVARTPSPLDAAQSFLARADERRLLADQPRALRPRAEPLQAPKPLIGPVAFGWSAKLAAVVMQVRHVAELLRAVTDRRLVIEARYRSGGLTLAGFRAAVEQIDGELRALSERSDVARARVAEVKRAIYESRVAGGARAMAERALRTFEQLFPSEDAPALWGGRPPAGSRLKSQPPPPAPTKADAERALVEKVVERL
jgi:hypothetical protein